MTNDQEYIQSKTNELYYNLVAKYGDSLHIVLKDSTHIDVTYINNITDRISVGALPGGKTEWYVCVLKNKYYEQTHLHALEDEIFEVIDENYIKINQRLLSFEKMEFKGHNNGYAMRINNHMNSGRVFLFSSVLYITSIFAFIYNIPYLHAFSIFPTLILLASFWVLTTRKVDDTFLEGTMQDHDFIIENGNLFRDGNQITDLSKLRLYRFRKFLFLKTKRTFYMIPNIEISTGTREKLLEWFDLRGIQVRIGL